MSWLLLVALLKVLVQMETKYRQIYELRRQNRRFDGLRSEDLSDSIVDRSLLNLFGLETELVILLEPLAAKS